MVYWKQWSQLLLPHRYFYGNEHSVCLQVFVSFEQLAWSTCINLDRYFGPEQQKGSRHAKN